MTAGYTSLSPAIAPLVVQELGANSSHTRALLSRVVSRTVAVFERLTNDQTPGLEQTTLTDSAGWQEQLRYAQNREVSD